jgi:small-conductance mechanosensitive channel
MNNAVLQFVGSRLWRISLAALLATGLAVAGAQAADAPATAPVKALTGAPPGVPVMLWQHEIVRFRATLGSVTPEERAQRAAQRIERIPVDDKPHAITVEALTLGPYSGYALFRDAQLLLGIADDDVDPQLGLSAEQVARRAARNIEHWLELRREQQNPQVFMRHLLVVLGATLLFAGALFGTVRLADFWTERRQRAAADEARRIVFARINFRPYLIALEVGVLRLCAWGIYLGLVYVWLLYTLNEFPYTRGWGVQLRRFLDDFLRTAGDAVLGSIPDLFAVMIIVLIARLMAAVVSGFFLTVERGRVRLSWLQPEVAHVTRRLCVGAIWLFAIVMAYPYIPGSESNAFKGISVLLGLMVSLGSAGVVGQIMGGFVVVYNRSLRVGEWARIAEHEGRVLEIGMLSTRLLTRKNEEITIPNAVLIASTTVNYSRRERDLAAIVSTPVTIGYDTPWRQVHAMLLEAAERTAGLRKHPAPRVLQRALQDFYVEYELFVPIDDNASRFVVLSELHANIQDVFNEHGVQIMSPHFVAQPEQAVVVPKENWTPPPAAKTDAA